MFVILWIWIGYALTTSTSINGDVSVPFTLTLTDSPYTVDSDSSFTDVIIENGVEIIMTQYDLTFLGNVNCGCNYDTSLINNRGLADENIFVYIHGTQSTSILIRDNNNTKIIKFCNTYFENMKTSLDFEVHSPFNTSIDNCYFDNIQDKAIHANIITNYWDYQVYICDTIFKNINTVIHNGEIGGYAIFYNVDVSDYNIFYGGTPTDYSDWRVGNIADIQNSYIHDPSVDGDGDCISFQPFTYNPNPIYTIYNNTISNCHGRGIYFASRSIYYGATQVQINVSETFNISHNIIQNTSASAIWLLSSTDDYSSGNSLNIIIRNNEFIDNSGVVFETMYGVRIREISENLNQTDILIEYNSFYVSYDILAYINTDEPPKNSETTIQFNNFYNSNNTDYFIKSWLNEQTISAQRNYFDSITNITALATKIYDKCDPNQGLYYELIVFWPWYMSPINYPDLPEITEVCSIEPISINYCNFGTENSCCDYGYTFCGTLSPTVLPTTAYPTTSHPTTSYPTTSIPTSAPATLIPTTSSYPTSSPEATSISTLFETSETEQTIYRSSETSLGDIDSNQRQGYPKFVIISLYILICIISIF